MPCLCKNTFPSPTDPRGTRAASSLALDRSFPKLPRSQHAEPPSQPVCRVAADSAVAFLDVDDVTQAFREASAAGDRIERARLDLDALRDWLSVRFHARWFICVARRKRPVPEAIVGRDAALRSGWQWATTSSRLWGPGTPPAAGYICAALECLRFESATTSAHTAIVIGHSDIYAAPMARFSQAARQAVCLGLIERFSDALVELTDDPKCELLDLEFDAKAATLPHRLLFEGTEARTFDEQRFRFHSQPGSEHDERCAS